MVTEASIQEFRGLSVGFPDLIPTEKEFNLRSISKPSLLRRSRTKIRERIPIRAISEPSQVLSSIPDAHLVRIPIASAPSISINSSGISRNLDISIQTRKKYSVFGFERPLLHLHNRDGWLPIRFASQVKLLSCFCSSSWTHNPKFIPYPIAIAWITLAYITIPIYFRVSSIFMH